MNKFNILFGLKYANHLKQTFERIIEATQNTSLTFLSVRVCRLIQALLNDMSGSRPLPKCFMSLAEVYRFIRSSPHIPVVKKYRITVLNTYVPLLHPVQSYSKSTSTNAMVLFISSAPPSMITQMFQRLQAVSKWLPRIQASASTVM